MFVQLSTLDALVPVPFNTPMMEYFWMNGMIFIPFVSEEEGKINSRCLLKEDLWGVKVDYFEIW